MNFVASIFIYFMSFGISMLLASIYQRKNISSKNKIRRFFWYLLIIAPPVFISTIRYGIGTDYFRYLVHIERVRSYPFDVAFNMYSKEPLYFLIQKVSGIFFSADWGFFLVSSFIIHFFIVASLDYYRQKLSLSFGLFVYYLYLFSFGLNGISQMIAIAIVLYSIKYILERKLLKFIIFIVFATLIHRSAIICLVFYFINIKKEKRLLKSTINYAYYGAILLSPIILVFVINLFVGLELFSSYSELVKSDGVNLRIGFLFYILPVFLPIVLFRKRMISISNYNSKLFDLMLMNIPFQYVGYYISWGSRMAYYTNSIYFIVIPLLVKSLKSRNDKILVSTYYVFYLILFYAHKYIYIASSEVFPFKTIFGL